MERKRTTTTTDIGYNTANAAVTTPTPPSLDVANDTSSDPPGLHYCWTHGLGRDPMHTSTTCNSRAEGHQAQVTIYNMMGGNASICRRQGERAIYCCTPRPNNQNAGPN